MSKPTVEIKMESPFTLRDLEQFLGDARNNGIDFREEVVVSQIHRGEYCTQFVDQRGNPTPVTTTALTINTREED